MPLQRIALFAIASALLALGGATTLASEERSAPRDMVDRVLAASLPGRDPLDLAVRLRGAPAGVPLVSPTVASPLAVGYEETFSVLDQRTAQFFSSKASLRLVTDHAYWFVDTSLSDRAPQPDLERSAAVFETRTYPLIHRYFGSEPQPGVDGDPRIVLLLANVPGVAAYFSSADAYPRTINPRSNQHEMIYVNLNALRPGQSGFDSTLTHEFQHMVHFARCPSQEGWVDEGASELATRVAGYEGGPPQAFAARPDVQLTSWSLPSGDVLRHYQAAYLFERYVAERAGGWDALPRLFSSCARGEALFSAFLQNDPIAASLDDLLADWSVANLVQDPSAADGRYAYANASFHAATTGALQRQTPFLGSAPQYAANYVELPTGTGVVHFSADASVPLFSAPLDNGDSAWWSNRGDSLDSRLTRVLDLHGLSHPVARFRVWYDLEDQFDFVYFSVSRDAGRTWQVVPGQHTAADRATGNNYGDGWTGSAGGGSWLDEQVDLSAFADTGVLVRFEYVTDQSYNGQGFAFKDFSVSDSDASVIDEPGAVEPAWQADGWVRVDAPVTERWNLRLVRWTDSGVHVDAIPVAADGSAVFVLDETATRAVLTITPTAPRTLLPGNYTVSITD